MKKKSIIILSIVGGVLLALVGGTSIYLNTYYKAHDIKEYLQSNENIKVEKIKEGYFFDSPSTDRALIFYPGAKVEYTAYAPLMYKLAENGYDCFLLKMPKNMAIFDHKKADKIIDKYSYTNYYLGGHSMGGAMACSYVAETSKDIKGLLLCAAYSAKDISKKDVSVISLYGSNDGVLGMDKVMNYRKYMPSSYYEFEIEGGNHANFASYGKQKGDNDASISMEEQLNFVAEKVKELW